MYLVLGLLYVLLVVREATHGPAAAAEVPETAETLTMY
jgi:hypothetical protein